MTTDQCYCVMKGEAPEHHMEHCPSYRPSKQYVGATRYKLTTGHSDDAGLGGEGWVVRMSDHFPSFDTAQKWVKAEDYEVLRLRFEKACARVTELESAQVEMTAGTSHPHLNGLLERLHGPWLPESVARDRKQAAAAIEQLQRQLREMTERKDAVNETLAKVVGERNELRAEVQRLQRALFFWLPGVPIEDSERAERIGSDTFLLVGMDGDAGKETAEGLGWVTLSAPETEAELSEPDELLTVARDLLPDPDFEPSEDREIKLRSIRDRIDRYLARPSQVKTKSGQSLLDEAIALLEQVRDGAEDEWPALNDFLKRAAPDVTCEHGVKVGTTCLKCDSMESKHSPRSRE